MKVIIDYKDGRKSHYYKVDRIIRTGTRLKLMGNNEICYEIEADKIKDFNIFDERKF